MLWPHFCIYTSTESKSSKHETQLKSETHPKRSWSRYHSYFETSSFRIWSVSDMHTEKDKDRESFVGGGCKKEVSECFGRWCYNCCILHTLLSVCHNAAFNLMKTQTGEQLTPSPPQQTDKVRMKRSECWLSASPAALWPRLQCYWGKETEWSIAVWLQGCVTHACPTKTEPTTASPVLPTHTLLPLCPIQPHLIL